MWLIFVLYLRLAAKKTTVWQDSSTGFYLHSERGVSWMSFISQPDLTFLPKGTWFLVDSNLEVTSINQRFLNTKAFIVQAASP